MRNHDDNSRKSALIPMIFKDVKAKFENEKSSFRRFGQKNGKIGVPEEFFEGILRNMGVSEKLIMTIILKSNS